MKLTAAKLWMRQSGQPWLRLTRLVCPSRVAKNMTDYQRYLTVSFEANVSEPWTKPGVATWTT